VACLGFCEGRPSAEGARFKAPEVPCRGGWGEGVPSHWDGSGRVLCHSSEFLKKIFGSKWAIFVHAKWEQRPVPPPKYATVYIEDKVQEGTGSPRFTWKMAVKTGGSSNFPGFCQYQTIETSSLLNEYACTFLRIQYLFQHNCCLCLDNVDDDLLMAEFSADF